MESNIINIATLTVDTKAASDQIVATRKEIFELQKANTELRKNISSGSGDVDAQTKLFIEQEQKIKSLQASYRQQSTALNEYTLTSVKNSDAIKNNAKSIEQANQQNKELISTRNQLDASTADGAKAIELINKKLDQNNTFIKDNSSALEKQKQNVGNYKSALEGVDSILSQFGINGQQARNVVQGFTSTVSEGTKGVTDIANSIGNAGAKLIGFKTSAMLATESTASLSMASETAALASTEMASGQLAASTATNVTTLSLRGLAVALAATGIGLIIIAVGLLINYFKDFDPLLDKIEQGFAAVGAVINVLSKAMASLFLQTDKSSGSFDNLGNKMADAAKKAIALKAAQQDLEDLQKSALLTNAQLSEQADRFLIQSKDKTKTEVQRIELLKKAEAAELSRFKLNEKLIKLEIENAKNAIVIKSELTDKEIQNLKRSGVAYAQYLQRTGKITDAQLKTLIDAEVKGVEIRKESNKFLEKNINSQNKLIEDQAAKQEKINEKNKADAEKQAAESIRIAQNKIDILKLEGKQNDITAEQKIKTAQKVFDLENQLAERALNGSDLKKKQIEIRQDLANTILEIAKAQITSEIDLQKKIITDKKNISETEKNDLLANAQFLRKTETDKINNSLLSQKEKNDALLQIETGFNESKTLINKSFEDADKLRKEEQATLDKLDFELKIIALEEQGLAENDLKKRLLEAEHEERLRLIETQVDAEGKLTATAKKQIEVENKKFVIAGKKIDDEVLKTKRVANGKMAQDAIASLQAVFGESKELAIASALINTYTGITSALKEPTLAQKIIGVTYATATGFAAVKNILSTDKGGGGGSASGGGGTGAGVGSTTPATAFENPAVTQTLATLQQVPSTTAGGQGQTVLVLETLQEVQQQQVIKIKSN